MATDIKLWKITKNQKGDIIRPIPAGFGLIKASENTRMERDLQNWILEHPDIVSDDLIVIGDEIEGIDILAITKDGQIAVIETKEAEPRTAIGQVIEYAALISQKNIEWLKKVVEKAGKNLNLEDIIGENEIDFENPKMYVVGTTLNDITEGIINFLSQFDIDINLVIIRYHKDPTTGDEYLTRTLFLAESTKDELRESRKRKTYKTMEAYLTQISTISGPEIAEKIRTLANTINNNVPGLMRIHIGTGNNPGLMIDSRFIKSFLYVYPNGKVVIWKIADITNVFGEDRIITYKQKLRTLGFFEEKNGAYSIDIANFEPKIEQWVEITKQLLQETDSAAEKEIARDS